MDQARLQVEHWVVDDGVVLTVAGEIDVTTAVVLDDALERAAAAAPVVVADLSAVAFLDSTGINTLLRAHHQMVARASRLALADASPPVLRILEITGVNEVIPLHNTVAQALNP